MSEKHTQGRLVVRGGYSIYADEGKTPVADTCLTASSDNDEANARRLVACWNACECFSTEMLEGAMSAVVQGGFVGLWSSYCDKKSEAEDLRSQRDELLAALKVAEESVGDSKSLEIVRAAIAKVEGTGV